MKELMVTCQTKERIDWRSIVPFQGNLKRRSDRDISKLSRSLCKHGITFPFFIWRKEGKNYCIDGHGRLLSFAQLVLDGWQIPDVPIVEIYAEDESEAKKKLLYENCKYGDLTYNSVMDFAGSLGVDMTDFSFPGGRMAYNEEFTFNPGSFEIVIPKITKAMAESEPEREVCGQKMETFRIGRMTVEMADEEAEMLDGILTDYLAKNNGLFGFISTMNAGG